MNVKDVNVSLIPLNGGVFVWNTSFTLDIPCPEKPEDREALQKKLASVIAGALKTTTL